MKRLPSLPVRRIFLGVFATILPLCAASCAMNFQLTTETTPSILLNSS